jgi:hypothetical protein
VVDLANCAWTTIMESAQVTAQMNNLMSFILIVVIDQDHFPFSISHFSLSS